MILGSGVFVFSDEIMSILFSAQSKPRYFREPQTELHERFARAIRKHHDIIRQATGFPQHELLYSKRRDVASTHSINKQVFIDLDVVHTAVAKRETEEEFNTRLTEEEFWVVIYAHELQHINQHNSGQLKYMEASNPPNIRHWDKHEERDANQVAYRALKLMRGRI
jgi:hypothetical protein